MFRILILLLFIIFTMLLAVGITFAYLAIYKRVINKRLANKSRVFSENRRRMPSPFTVAVFVFAVVQLIMIFVIIFEYQPKKALEYHYDNVLNGPSSVWIQNCNKGKITDNFSPDRDIQGYDRYEKSDGDFKFVYYVTKDWDDNFPKLFIYAEYQGKKTYKYNGYYSRFEQEGGVDGGGYDPIEKTDDRGVWFSANFGVDWSKMEFDYFVCNDKLNEKDELTEKKGAGELDFGVLRLNLDEIVKE